MTGCGKKKGIKYLWQLSARGLFLPQQTEAFCIAAGRTGPAYTYIFTKWYYYMHNQADN